MKHKFLYQTALLLSTITGISCANAFAQQSVRGTVTDASGQPLIGVGVMVEGTSIGSVTDLDGNYSIVGNLPEDAVLSFSSIGYIGVTIPVSGKTEVNAILKEDEELLDEVIVVGYGVQKKSVVTASIAKVSADDLGSTAPVRMDNALKGLAAGVTVTSSSGQPGAAARIRVRGVGTINDSDPLYIVDGMPIEGGLDYLNPNDISSIEVLKDAASGAVYGARAANGVVLVTTKTGKTGKTRVSYDFSYGWQSAWRHRDVLNASEYAVMMNEGRINAGMTPLYSDPYSYGEGTDWQSEVFNDGAPVSSHQVSISGASEKVSYLLSLGYYSQDGIVGGNYGRSNYDRLTLRSNTSYTIFDDSADRDWLNSLKLTSNISYAKITSTSVSDNSQWGSPLGSALALSPILGVYEDDPESVVAGYVAQGISEDQFMYSKDGRLYMIPGSSYNEMTNPVASMSLPATEYWTHKVVANFSGELQLWDGLKFRTSYGIDLSFYGGDGYTPVYYLSGNNQATRSSVSSYSDRSSVWQLENTLSYDKTIGKHTFSVLLGQSAKESNGYYLGGSSANMKSYDKPYIDYTYGVDTPVTILTDSDGEYTGYQTNISIYGGRNATAALASLFARASYNYDERYMAQFTIRRDGSSRFGSNNHYAIFPSFSLGWNITNEDFMKAYRNWLSNLKLRFSWGKNGNENIGNFMYTVLTSSGNNYIFGANETVYSGVKSSGLANADLKWEESRQTDVGLDFGFFGGALTFTADYYYKKTNGMLMEMNIPSYVGETKPYGNVGEMENQGIEFEASYKYSHKDFSMRVSGNLSFLKNKLINYGNDTGWANLDSFQGAGTISRAQNGEPFPYFYGYKTDGIFQNWEEIYAYVNSNGELIMPDAVPGDVRFVDVDSDGNIDDDDRTRIGKGMPDWTFGLNFSASWKGFDISMMWQGTIGNDVFDATRRTDITTSNLPSWMLARWTGEGTSNKIPRFVLGDSANWQSSDLYVHDGSYMRLKNIQIGYTLPERITRKVFINSLRFYVAAENLLTFTSYYGYDPEISSGGTSLGIDYGVYPQARSFSIGCNLVF